MASKLAKLEQETITNSLEIVHHKVRLLMEVWKMFFDEICYLDYLTSLPSSIEQFLGEIYCLTMSFCVRKTQRIRGLQTELFELRRVLGVSSDEPEDEWERGDISLDRKLSLLQQRVNLLRQQNQERVRLMEEYMIEETMLLCDLGEAAPVHEPLCPNPETGKLPDAQRMAQFGDYLSRLRAEKVKRIATREKLQSDIRRKAQLLDWVPRKDRHRQIINQKTLLPSLDNLHELQHLDFVLSGLLERKRQQEQQGQKPSQPPQKEQQKSQEKQQQQQNQNQPEQHQDEQPDQNKQQQQKHQVKQQQEVNAQKPPQQQPPKQKQQPPAQSTKMIPISQTPPPPPPPPSPASEMDAANAGGGAGSIFERTIEVYKLVDAETGHPVVRERIIKEMFQRVRASINVWWERCLISPSERQQCTVLYTNQLDEDAFVAHIEQQKLLKSYYRENEPIFVLIFQWSELWNKYLQHERSAISKPDTEANKKPSVVTATTEPPRQREVSKELEEMKQQLDDVKKQLEGKCREFEQRCQVKFTMYGMPVMHVLRRCQEKREELKLAACCKPYPSNRNWISAAATAAGQKLSPKTAEDLARMLDIVVVRKSNPNGGPDLMAIAWDQVDPQLATESLPEAETHSDSDDSNRSGSSSGEDADQKRDDELLEEAFASATAVTTKSRIHSVNGHPAS